MQLVAWPLLLPVLSMGRRLLMVLQSMPMSLPQWLLEVAAPPRAAPAPMELSVAAILTPLALWQGLKAVSSMERPSVMVNQ